MTNRPEFLSALFGTAMAGGVAVALSTFSTAKELQHLISSSCISTLLFEDKVLKKDFAALLVEIEPRINTCRPGELCSIIFPYLQQLVRIAGVTADSPSDSDQSGFRDWSTFLEGGKQIPTGVVDARISQVDPCDPGGLFFSSGTTSLPKGILHSQRAFAIQWWRWPNVTGVLKPARAWTSNGFFWSGNIAIIVGIGLSHGGTIVMQPLFDAAEALRLIEAEKVTFVNGRPHQWARMQSEATFMSTDLSSLTYITRGDILRSNPTVDTDWEMPMGFGATETMTINTSYGYNVPEEQYAGSVGVPLPGNIIKIVNPESGEVVPLGERGEICVKGPTVMMEYIGKAPEETFDFEGFYCTGDGGYFDSEGRLFWEGRLNDIIKTGGANVSPQEIDERIAKFPGIRRTQTVGIPHETLSEMIVVCIVPNEGCAIDKDKLLGFLKEELASYKLPKEVLLFTEEEFPITGNEKVKSGQVREMALKRLGIAIAAEA